jgi:hypothetical protein
MIKTLVTSAVSKVDKALPIVQKYFPLLTRNDLEFIWSWTAAWSGVFSGDAGKSWLSIASKLPAKFRKTPAHFYRGIKLKRESVAKLLVKGSIRLKPKSILSWTTYLKLAHRYAVTAKGYGLVLHNNPKRHIPIIYLTSSLIKLFSGGFKSLLDQNEIITKGQPQVNLEDVLYILAQGNSNIEYLEKITGVVCSIPVKNRGPILALRFRKGKPSKWVLASLWPD